MKRVELFVRHSRDLLSGIHLRHSKFLSGIKSFKYCGPAKDCRGDEEVGIMLLPLNYLDS